MHWVVGTDKFLVSALSLITYLRYVAIFFNFHPTTSIVIFPEVSNLATVRTNELPEVSNLPTGIKLIFTESE